MPAPRAVTTEATIWRRIMEPGHNGLSSAAARSLLKLTFDERDTTRMNELAEKNRAGRLTPGERQELNSYIKVGDVLPTVSPTLM